MRAAVIARNSPRPALAAAIRREGLRGVTPVRSGGGGWGLIVASRPRVRSWLVARFPAPLRGAPQPGHMRGTP
ncbi:hypothetical protein WN71_001230 [Streptomyces mangrovisoli]|uniref:Uncharacterized protein n=1 Tax=Streptomyces mangrovisoli TaxID=1428628 RepID=A0A1J4P444_9ACTN|nr:hypothetical protein WN71_001230 [Streptomyces mangrovisoli]